MDSEPRQLVSCRRPSGSDVGGSRGVCGDTMKMGRPLEDRTEKVMLHVLVPRVLVRKLDELKRSGALDDTGLISITRSDVIRVLLSEGVERKR